jgi:hypothetical protein
VQLTQQTAALSQQLSQVWGQSFLVEIELVVGIVAASLELAEAQLQASNQANVQGRSHAASASPASATPNTSGVSTNDSTGHGTHSKSSNDNYSGSGTDTGTNNDNGNNDGDGNGNGGQGASGIDNVLSRVVENLLDSVQNSSVLRADVGRVVQLVFGGGSGPAETVATLPVNNLPALRAGGSAVGQVSSDLAPIPATRLVSPGDAAQALVQFGGGQRSGGIDLMPFSAGGVGVIPQYVVGGSGAATTPGHPGPGGVFGAAPAGNSGAATPDTSDATPRAVQDLELKKYLLGPEPRSQPPAEPPTGTDRSPQTNVRSPRESVGVEDISETAVTDAVLAGGYEQELDVPALDADTA